MSGCTWHCGELNLSGLTRSFGDLSDWLHPLYGGLSGVASPMGSVICREWIHLKILRVFYLSGYTRH